MSLPARIASASGVVGPLAPSARTRQRSLPALAPLMTRSTAAGTLAAADAATQLHRLARDDLRAGVADAHAVGVHDPGHGLLVGPQVGGHHVHARPNHAQDFLGKAAGEALLLAHGNFFGVH